MNVIKDTNPGLQVWFSVRVRFSTTKKRFNLKIFLIYRKGEGQVRRREAKAQSPAASPGSKAH
jgi:hypothetical protein